LVLAWFSVQLLLKPRTQEVNVAKAKIEVAQEEEAIAQRQVEVAQEEVAAAKQKLEAAQISVKYSTEEVPRLEFLYQQGASDLQSLEDAREQKQLDQTAVSEILSDVAIQEKNVQEVQQNLLGKQKNVQEAEANLQLILNEVYPEEIEAARQEVETGRAELRQQQQKLRYALSKKKKTKLVMPFNGYLVDSYLNQKIGSYFNQGDTYTLVQNKSQLLFELEIPEYDAGEIPVGAQAEVRMLAYPNQPLMGKVLAVEPASSEESYGRVLKAMIQVTDTKKNLRPGMSGYGKVYTGKKPLIALLTSPLVRFLEIEFWSWWP
jgi:putative peptide zinc metalloprotease protein